MKPIHSKIARITERIQSRSEASRTKYLARINAAASRAMPRTALGCANLAHTVAAAPDSDKTSLQTAQASNIAIVTSYNDMLSAHQPFERFPAVIKQAAREVGAVAQVAGGVPAMCDGITQGRAGMELSLFSRDVIAMSTAVALSHEVFDAALCLGVCDKIVPGLLIGALSFGHLPTIFVPAGPMRTASSQSEKSKVREQYAAGKISKEELLASELKCFHSAGTCTFYGTANSNQMLMEFMGLHLPGAAFVNPDSELRDALTAQAAKRVAEMTYHGKQYTPLGRVVDEKSIVNAIIGLLATGGSTNHTMHLVAIAHAAGIKITWNDFSELSIVIPTLARIYPNGKADINDFQSAGGVALVMRELLQAGLLHSDAQTVAGEGGLLRYAEEPHLQNSSLAWRAAPEASRDASIISTVEQPFARDGGLKLLEGNLGRAIVKTSSLKDEHRVVEAPALVFDSQEEVLRAFSRGELDRDFVAVVRFQGPRARGMPELHKLTPPLALLQERGFHVALVTDGRMSGASGKVPAAIHVTPECMAGGLLSLVQNGDILVVDTQRGKLEARVSMAEFSRRRAASPSLESAREGCGRELFDSFRTLAGGAEQGASFFYSGAVEDAELDTSGDPDSIPGLASANAEEDA
ncbi:MAG: phosphogluconate dehydratase [Deltaproteobacteria bacterium]|nr:phosphogluconate dehydratase [Deltaproteobacteria bacterium]